MLFRTWKYNSIFFLNHTALRNRILRNNEANKYPSENKRFIIHHLPLFPLCKLHISKTHFLPIYIVYTPMTRNTSFCIVSSSHVGMELPRASPMRGFVARMTQTTFVLCMGRHYFCGPAPQISLKPPFFFSTALIQSLATNGVVDPLSPTPKS